MIALIMVDNITVYTYSPGDNITREPGEHTSLSLYVTSYRGEGLGPWGLGTQHTVLVAYWDAVSGRRYSIRENINYRLEPAR